MGESDLRGLIRAYALVVKARGIHKRIDSMRAANDEHDPGCGPFGEEWFNKCERDLDEIGKEMTLIEERMSSGKVGK